MTPDSYEHWVIGDEFSHTRIDYFLKKKLKQFSYPTVCTLIRKGLIKVNNKKVSNNHILNVHDKVKLKKELVQNKNKKTSYQDVYKFKKLLNECSIYEDENFVAINKPPGLAVQGGSKVKNSIDEIMTGFTSNFKEKPKLVHRLDKFTSGVLILAKNLKSASFITSLFKKRKIKKTYLAIIEGSLKVKNSKIELPIFSGEKKLEAITKYKVIEEKNNFSLLIIRPKTGRKNQIRKHFFLINKPILGDFKFLPEIDSSEKKTQLYLHSYKTEFIDQNKKTISIKANMPEYFTHFLKNNNFKEVSYL